MLSPLFLSAFASSNALTAPTRPLQAAKCKAACPCVSAMSRQAPFSSRNRTRSSWPCRTAMHKGVRLSLQALSMSAPDRCAWAPANQRKFDMARSLETLLKCLASVFFRYQQSRSHAHRSQSLRTLASLGHLGRPPIVTSGYVDQTSHSPGHGTKKSSWWNLRWGNLPG